MDRRDFFKSILATSLLSPFLLASDQQGNDEIFLIADCPEAYLPALLEKQGTKTAFFANRRFLLVAPPRGAALSRALGASGWTQASRGQNADLTISFRPLQQPAAPSFTLVRNGRIWDIRTKDLFSLWQKMNKDLTPSSCMTIASLRTGRSVPAQGTAVRMYHDGRLVEELSLKKDRIKTFRNSQGHLTAKIEQGKVSIPSSSCRHKVCCAASPAVYAGDRIVCAPNHFLLEVQGPRSFDTIIG